MEDNVILSDACLRKTIAFQWQAAHLTEGACSRELMQHLKENVNISKLNSDCLDLLSCSFCHSVFSPGQCKIRTTPKPRIKKKLKKTNALTNAEDRKKIEKIMKKKSYLTAKCNTCGKVTKSEGASRKEINEIVEKRRQFVKEIVVPNVTLTPTSTQHKTPTATPALSKSELKKHFQSLNKRPSLGQESNTSSKKKKKRLNRSSKLADMLKADNNNSPNTSLSSFLS